MSSCVVSFNHQSMFIIANLLWNIHLNLIAPNPHCLVSSCLHQSFRCLSSLTICTVWWTPLFHLLWSMVPRPPLAKYIFSGAVGNHEDSVSVTRLKPLLASGPVEPALHRHHGHPPHPKPRATPPAAPHRRGRPKNDPPPSPPASKLRRGRSAGLNPAVPRPQSLGGSCDSSETPCITVLRIALLLYMIKLMCSSVCL